MTSKETFIVSVANAFTKARTVELATAQVRGLCYGVGIVNGVDDSEIEIGVEFMLRVHALFEPEDKVATIEYGAMLLFRERQLSLLATGN